VKTYKLAGSYDLYFEYAELLATRGLIQEAVSFLKLTPSDYKAAIDFGVVRDRLLNATKVSAVPAVSPAAPTSVPAVPYVGHAQPQHVARVHKHLLLSLTLQPNPRRTPLTTLRVHLVLGQGQCFATSHQANY
jgi:protein transport protein SEC31